MALELVRRSLDFVFPPCCLVCDRRLVRLPDDNGSPLICEHCRPHGYLHADSLALDEDESSCIQCGEMSVSWSNDQPRCIFCSRFQPAFRHVRSIFENTARVDSILKTLKYRGRYHLSRVVADYIIYSLNPTAALHGSLLDTPPVRFEGCSWDLVIGVPSSTDVLKSRGFSHTTIIARMVGKAQKIQSSPLLLRSKGKRPAQAGVELKRRRNNIKDAFQADSAGVRNKRILLIDDLLTTGSSLDSAASELLNQGAAFVDALTFSRARHYSEKRFLAWRNPRAYVKN